MARLGAGVRKRADGRLEKRFMIKGKSYSVYGKTAKEIADKEQELRNLIDAGQSIEKRNITLDKYFTEWIDGKRSNTKANSLRAYKSYYDNHISNTFGNRRITTIERREVVSLQGKLSKTMSAKAVNYTIKVLRMILADAVRDEIIIKNPADDIKQVQEAEKKITSKHRALTEEEQKAFMGALEGTYYYEFFAMLLCTGMRIGEVEALKWSDIDYENNVIHIRRTVTCTEQGKRVLGDSPKSKAGERDIPITKDIRAILQSQKAKQRVIVQMGANTIFTSTYGNMINACTVSKEIDSAIERLANNGFVIERFTAHALRDTFATRFIEQGGNPQTLKTLLGHSNLSMTMDLYAQVLPNVRQEEMDRLVMVM